MQPYYYGGIGNTITSHQFEINIFVQFLKQPGLNYLNSISNFTPGYKYRNQPVVVLNRWQKPGDATTIQRFTTLESGSTNQSNNLINSEAVYGNASYLRVKMVSLTYTVSNSLVKKINLNSAQLFVLGQNLLTITKYEGADPENQNIYRMPPLKTIVLGLKIIF